MQLIKRMRKKGMPDGSPNYILADKIYLLDDKSNLIGAELAN